MAKVALNKSSLNKEKRSLKTFNRYLPALDTASIIASFRLPEPTGSRSPRKKRVKICNIHA